MFKKGDKVILINTGEQDIINSIEIVSGGCWIWLEKNGRVSDSEIELQQKIKTCSICKEKIEDVEILTVESGWFIVDKVVKYCPYCGRKL